MAEIVPISGDTVCKEIGLPQPEIIERLEGLLADARAGRVQGLGLAVIGPQGDMTTGWAGSNVERAYLVAGIALLYHRVMAWQAHGGA